MGYVIQNAGLFQHRTIVDNIATVPRMLGWGKEKARARAPGADGAGRARRRARQAVPVPAVRRPAAARRRGPGARRRSAGAADGRAVLAPSTPSSARACRTNCCASRTSWARPSSSSPTTSTRPSSSATWSPCCAPAASSPSSRRPPSCSSSPADAFVEDFLGADRGIRRLSFFPSAGLRAATGPVVAVDATAEQIAARDTADGPLSPRHRRGRQARSAGASRRQLTAGERRRRATAAVRAAVRRRHGLAAGRAGLRRALAHRLGRRRGRRGRVAGVVSQQAIGEAIRGAHAQGRADAPGAGLQGRPMNGFFDIPSDLQHSWLGLIGLHLRRRCCRCSSGC